MTRWPGRSPMGKGPHRRDPSPGGTTYRCWPSASPTPTGAAWPPPWSTTPRAAEGHRGPALAVTETNPARALYERLGFREVPPPTPWRTTAPSRATSTGPPKAFSALRPAGVELVGDVGQHEPAHARLAAVLAGLGRHDARALALGARQGRLDHEQVGAVGEAHGGNRQARCRRRR